jgi:hypothetical protein
MTENELAFRRCNAALGLARERVTELEAQSERRRQLLEKSDERVSRLSARVTELEARLASPIDILLFCPNCAERHVDEAKPDICETCGHGEAECSCAEYTAWLNPPHKSHRCEECNHVWRPADVPTNGVRAIQTKGLRDGNPKPRYFLGVERVTELEAQLAEGQARAEAAEARLAEANRKLDAAKAQWRTQFEQRQFIGDLIDNMPMNLLLADLQAAEARAEAMRKALEMVEWVRNVDHWQICPWCEADKLPGHKSDCARQAALAPKTKEGQ